MVGLDGPGGDQRVGTLRECVGGQVLKFAQLVATHGQRCQIVAFDIDITPQPARQAIEFFQGGGVGEEVQAIKTSQLLFDHGSVRVVGDVWTIGRLICSGNRETLMQKSAENSTISS
ncbi:hypothetical protein D3C78_1172910 [compost metagenome]